MTDEQEITRYLSIIEYYKEQISAIEMQSQYLQAAIADYNKAKITLENLKKTKVDSEILVPIGGSTYLNAETKDTTNVLFDIGAGYVMEKPSEEAIKKIDERIKDLEKNLEQMMSTMQKLQTEAEELAQKTQELMGERK